ncbi:MAG: class I SAM-dependent methyltransferase [Nanoarchaeota archaeon]
MTASDHSEQYDAMHQGMKLFWHSPSEDYYFYKIKDNIARFFIKEIQSKKNISVLDVGCGLGMDILMLNRKANRTDITFTGIDVSPVAIKTAQAACLQLGISNCNFRVADFSSENLENRAEQSSAGPSRTEFGSGFDIVLASEVIEHMADVKASLLKLRSFLKKDGALILSTPNENHFLKQLSKAVPKKIISAFRNEQKWLHMRRYWQDQAESTHVSVQTPSQLKKALAETGFINIELRRGGVLFGGPWLDKRPFLFSLAIMLDALLPKSIGYFGSDVIIKANSPD